MNQPKLVKTLFSVILLLILTFQAQSMSNSKKIIELEINSENINYFIMFNKVKVYSELENSPIKQFIPLNEWALNHTNTLQIYVDINEKSDIRKIEKNSKLIVSVILKENKDGIKKKYLLSKFNIKPSNDTPDIVASETIQNIKLSSKDSYKENKNGDVFISPLTLTPIETWTDFSQTISMDMNLPTWSFISADFIGDDQTMSDSEYYSIIDDLYSELQNIWNLMKDKKTSEILKLTSTRSSEYDAAYYKKNGEKQTDMKDSLESAFNHDDLYLSELIKKDQVQLSIEANGKIANLKLAGTSQPLIYYSHKNNAFTRFYDFYFMKKDNHWIIIR